MVGRMVSLGFFFFSKFLFYIVKFRHVTKKLKNERSLFLLFNYFSLCFQFFSKRN